jgi:hypothetical protein
MNSYDATVEATAIDEDLVASNFGATVNAAVADATMLEVIDKIVDADASLRLEWMTIIEASCYYWCYRDSMIWFRP